jgi:hypothetical protein
MYFGGNSLWCNSGRMLSCADQLKQGQVQQQCQGVLARGCPASASGPRCTGANIEEFRACALDFKHCMLHGSCLQPFEQDCGPACPAPLATVLQSRIVACMPVRCQR